MKRALTALVLLSLASGCAKQAATAASPPTAAEAAVGGDGEAGPQAPGLALDDAAPASFDALQARLDELDADLSAEGITPAEEPRVGETRPERGATAKATEDGTRCERICSLKDAICDVAERICSLAEAHEDEANYTDACTRATGRCEQASTACEACED